MELIKDFSPFSAILFDLDGTLANTLPIGNQTWHQALAAFSCKVTDEVLLELTGIPVMQTIEILNSRFGWHLDPHQVATRKEALFYDQIHLVQPIAKVVAVATENFGKLPMAVVSGGARKTVAVTLKQIRLDHLFQTVVCAEDTSEHKPKPAPYLLAAGQLGVLPERCLVYEDGQAGLQAARAAGMKCVQVD